MWTVSICTTGPSRAHRLSGLISSSWLVVCCHNRRLWTECSTSPPECPGKRIQGHPRGSTPILALYARFRRLRSISGASSLKRFWRPLNNLPVAGRRIQTPSPVTLPAGHHKVIGPPDQTLPVDIYPAGTAGKKRKRKSPAPVTDALIAEFHTMEEKGSDVNLAAHLLNDAWNGLFDVAAVISNDTDLVTPIRMVTAERGKSVIVVCPGRWQAAPKLRAVASGVRHIRKPMLQAAQFPDPIPGTTISKPTGW